MITSCAYLAIMCFTLVMEKEVIVAIGGIIANLAKIFKLAVVHNFRPLHTHTDYMKKNDKKKKLRMHAASLITWFLCSSHLR